MTQQLKKKPTELEINMKHKQSTSTPSLKKLTQEVLRVKQPKTVAELFQIIQKEHPTVTREDVVEVVKRLIEDGKIELELPPLSVETYLQYLRARSQNVWFYLVIVASIATLVAVYIIPNTYPPVIFRWIVGSIFILFLPGFATIQALFPAGEELDDVERFALSVGLSLAITPMIGLLLNYTPWGIRLDPIMISLSLFTMSVAAVATYRKYKIVLTNSSGGKRP